MVYSLSPMQASSSKRCLQSELAGLIANQVPGQSKRQPMGKRHSGVASCLAGEHKVMQKMIRI